MKNNFLIILDQADQPYAFKVKSLLPAGAQGTISYGQAYTHISMLNLAARKYDYIITTNAAIASLLLDKKIRSAGEEGSTGTITDYAGKVLKHPLLSIEVLILLSLKQLVTTSTAEFLNKRYISKFTAPTLFYPPTEFNWELVDNETTWNKAYTACVAADFVVVDIETSANLSIKCVGFGAFKYDTLTQSYTSTNHVIPFKELHHVHWCRTLCALPVEKAAHNGMYDIVWLLIYTSPLNNFKWDTLGMMHSWYVELPRSLDFTTGFLLRDVPYWKDESGSNLYEYNAKDCWATGNCLLAWMRDAPSWAHANYLIKFPEVFPSLCCEMEGIKVDPVAKSEMLIKQNEILDRELKSIQTMIGINSFNPASPVQMKQLLYVLGCSDLVDKVNKWSGEVESSSDSKVINKAILRHPINARVLGSILRYKKAKKALSTYIEARLYYGRFIYRLNPFGTESGRSSSSGSSLAQVDFGKTGTAKPKYLHYGTNVQNMPRETEYAKAMMVADEGFLLCEIDKSASESYCTALLSGDETLWEVLHSGKDFHKSNASMFFGVPYEEVDKPLRQLAKPVNHGANYNMGALTLVETMGEVNIYAAKSLLMENLLKYPSAENTVKYSKLSRCKELKQIAQYLLDGFHATYKRIGGRWYAEVANEVLTTSMIKSPSGWTRYCFENPQANKNALNSYIAHGPQHLSVMLLNQGFYKLFKELQDSKTFRLKAQIHDSIFFQYKEDREDLVHKANAILQGTIIYKGKSLTIPNDASYGNIRWSKLK